MKKALRVSDYLEHIVEAIDRVLRYTEGLDESDFLRNEMIQDAVVRNIEIVGEAAKNIQRVDPSFAAAHSEVPWQQMNTMRNRLSHGYDNIDYALVWNLILEGLPSLQQLVKATFV